MSQQQHAQSDVIHDLQSSAASATPDSISSTVINPSVNSQLDYIDDRWGITQTLTNPIEQLITYIHDTTGYPWWITIIGVTLLLRTILFPVALSQVKLGARLSHVMPVLKRSMDEFKARQQSSESGLSHTEIKEHQRRMANIIREHDAHPLKMFRPILIFAPTFILLFSTLRHMAHTHPSMTTGGALWFKDLTALDAYWGLPLLSAISTILSIKYGAGEFTTTDARTEQMKDMFVIMAAVFAVVAAYYIPSAVFLYWTANNMFTFMQGRIFANKRVRDILKIPAPRVPTPEERAESQSKLMNFLTLGRSQQKPTYEQASIINNTPTTQSSTHQKLQEEQQQLQQKIVTLYTQKPKKKTQPQQQQQQQAASSRKKHMSTMIHKRVYCTLVSDTHAYTPYTLRKMLS
jgi:YidC/Oxa1 family membrane protein insertase